MNDTVRIGVLRDAHKDVDDAFRPDVGGNAMRLVIDQVNEAGGLHGRQIELVARTPGRTNEGADGNIEETLACWNELVDEGVLGIIGPCMTPNAIAVLPYAESVKIPAIHWAGTEEAIGDWLFQFQAGSFPDEGVLLAYLFARKGHRKVACFRGAGDYGKGYLYPFVRSVKELGVEVVAEYEVSRNGENLEEHVAAAHQTGADAMVAMGLFSVGVLLAEAIRKQGWDVACYGNCGFALGAAYNPEALNVLSGWIVTDMFDPFNATTQRFLDQYEQRYGNRPVSSSPCFGRDLATLMVEGIRQAPELTRAGLRQGLESVRNIPAATGGAGSRLGFSPRERLTPLGPRFFVLREIQPEGLEILSV